MEMTRSIKKVRSVGEDGAELNLNLTNDTRQIMKIIAVIGGYSETPSEQEAGASIEVVSPPPVGEEGDNITVIHTVSANTQSLVHYPTGELLLLPSPDGNVSGDGLSIIMPIGGGSVAAHCTVYYELISSEEALNW